MLFAIQQEPKKPLAKTLKRRFRDEEKDYPTHRCLPIGRGSHFRCFKTQEGKLKAAGVEAAYASSLCGMQGLGDDHTLESLRSARPSGNIKGDREFYNRKGRFQISFIMHHEVVKE